MTRLAAVALAVLLAGCAEPASVGQDPAPTPSATTPTTAYAADEAVLRVSIRGGLVPRERLPDLPYWSLYGDGRVFTRGPEPAIYPGRALPNVQVGTVAAGTVERIVAAAREAGIDGVERDYGDPPVADGGTTVFRLRTEDGVVETAVYALSEAGGEGNDARRKLHGFLRGLTAAEPDGGFGSVSDEEPYEPAAIAVFARPYGDDGLDDHGDVEAQVLRWRGPALASGTRSDPGACTVLTGAALDTVLPDLRTATDITRWQDGGDDWALQLRPLLPGESTCADALA